MPKTVKCEMCGAKARHVVTKEFDGKIMNFCCRSCLEVYKVMRAEGLVQTEAEERFFSRNPRNNAQLNILGHAGPGAP